MKTEFVINENEETVTIQAINGVVKELTFSREDYERLKEAINQPKVLVTDDFQDFWMMYPKKSAKIAAQKAWKKLNPSRELVIKIFSALAKAKVCSNWKKDGGQYIPLPASWLNGQRWEDELIEERENDKYDPATAALERIRRRRDSGRNQSDVPVDIRGQIYENGRLGRKDIDMDEFLERGTEGND